MFSFWAGVPFTLAFVAILGEELTPDDVQFKINDGNFPYFSDFDTELVDVVKEDDVESILTQQIQAWGGAGTKSDRLLRLMASLRPLFIALPKDSDNRLAYQTSRYALHRHMMKAHGWFIRGLEPSSQEKAHGVGVVSEWVPAYLHGLISTRSGMDGESLEDLALSVATIEDLVGVEVTKKMTALYKYLGMSAAEPLARDLAACVIDSFVYYMFTAMIIEGTKGKDPFGIDSYSFNTSARRHMMCNGGVIQQAYVEWPSEIWQWSDLVDIAVADSGPDLLSFQQVLSIAFKVAFEAHTVFEDDCSALRGALLSIESHPGTGRVTLEAYYKKERFKYMEFSESKDLLRNASMLDEATEPPTLVVANYVSNRANCVVPSSMYAMCCKLPCDFILSQLEQKLSSPVGRADEIASGVGANLSHDQWKRLRMIERIHGGRVPIHSEAFAIWLHHVHPRDCPLVHPDRTAEFPMTAGEWLHDVEKSWAEESQAMAAYREGTGSRPGFLLCALAGSAWFMSGRSGSWTAQVLQNAFGEPRAAVARKLLAFFAAASGLAALVNSIHLAPCLLMLVSFTLVRGILGRLQAARATVSRLDDSCYKQV